MARSSVLQEISIFLRDLLINGINSPQTPFTANDISLNSPVEFTDGTAPGGVKLSLYLYHIQKNEHLNNESLLRIGNQQFLRPFYVDLSYLVTPISKSESDNLELIGRCIQIFSANGILRAPFLRLEREPSQGDVRLRMLQYDLEAMNKLWGALTKPYRMSIAYELSPIPIESLSPPQSGPPIEEAILGVQQMSSKL